MINVQQDCAIPLILYIYIILPDRISRADFERYTTQRAISSVYNNIQRDFIFIGLFSPRYIYRSKWRSEFYPGFVSKKLFFLFSNFLLVTIIYL